MKRPRKRKKKQYSEGLDHFIKHSKPEDFKLVPESDRMYNFAWKDFAVKIVGPEGFTGSYMPFDPLDK